MADSVTKIVNYEIRGDDTGLINTVEKALKKLDVLDARLATIAKRKDISPLTENETRDALSRIGSINNALAQLDKIRVLLSSTDTNLLTSAQVALIKQAAISISDTTNQLGKAKDAGTVTAATLKSVVTDVNTLTATMKKADITTVNYAKEERELARALKEQERAQQAAEKVAVKAAKEQEQAQAKAAKAAKEAARQAQLAYENAVRTTVSAVRTMIYAIRSIVTAGYKLMSFSADYAETINKFNVVVGESSEVLGEFVNKMANTLGLDLGDIYEATSTFKSIANSINLASDKAIMFTKTMTMLSVDLASLYNTSADEAINALTSGLHGVLKPLKQYNIYLFESNLAQTAIKIGLNKSIDSLNESEKVLLRYISILDQSEAAQGDMARTLSSSANQIRITKAQFTMLKRSLGQLVTVIGLTVIPVLNSLFAGLTKTFTYIAQSMGYEIENFANIFEDSTDDVEDGTNALEEYEDTAKGLSDLDEINLINQNASTGTSTEETTSGLSIDPKILDALKTYDNKMDQITESIGKIGDTIGKALSDTLITDAFSLIIAGFKAMASAIKFASDNWAIFGPVIKTVINLLGILIGIAVVNKVKSWVVAIGGLVTKLKAFTMVMPSAIKEIDLISMGLDKSAISISGATLAWGALAAAASYAVFSSIFESFNDKTRKIVGTIAILVAALTTGAIAWMAFNGAMSWGVAVPIIGAAIGLGAASIKALIPQPATMATGGVVTTTTPAIIGEGKYDEAVIPLGNSPQFKSMKEGIAAEVLRSLPLTPAFQSVQQSRANTPIVLQINGREFARAVLPDLGYAQPQTGVKLTR